MAHVYILESLRDGRYYIGSTDNLEERLKNHNRGGTYSTKRFGDLKIVFKQEYDTFSEARKVESWLKRLKRKDYLKKIVKEGLIKRNRSNF